MRRFRRERYSNVLSGDHEEAEEYAEQKARAARGRSEKDMPEVDSPHLAWPNTLRRFASDAPLVVRLAREDQTFRSVCDDYELTANALTRLLREAGRESEANEYLAIAVELENEILKLLRSSA